jgi:hypothetical protein
VLNVSKKTRHLIVIGWVVRISLWSKKMVEFKISEGTSGAKGGVESGG